MLPSVTQQIFLVELEEFIALSVSYTCYSNTSEDAFDNAPEHGAKAVVFEGEYVGMRAGDVCVTFNAYGIEFVCVRTYLCSRFLNCVSPYAQDLYVKGKAKSGGDKSEMDWDGFEFVMRKVAGIVD